MIMDLISRHMLSILWLQVEDHRILFHLAIIVTVLRCGAYGTLCYGILRKAMTKGYAGLLLYEILQGMIILLGTACGTMGTVLSSLTVAHSGV